MNTGGIVGSMTYSDVVILEVLKALIAEHGADTPISYATICEATGASLSTTIRALKRLRQQQRIVADYTPRIGYRYRIANGSPRRND